MKSKHVTANQRTYFILETEPEKWPTTDELPQADTTDLEKTYQYQSTIDSDFESW